MTYILKCFFLVILLWLVSDSIAYKYSKYGKYTANEHRRIVFKHFKNFITSSKELRGTCFKGTFTRKFLRNNFLRPRTGESISRSWSHPVVLNQLQHKCRWKLTAFQFGYLFMCSIWTNACLTSEEARIMSREV